MSPTEEATARKALDFARTQYGASELARRIGGITPQAISKWKVVPPARALAFRDATGIPLSKVRPDLYRRIGASR